MIAAESADTGGGVAPAASPRAPACALPDRSAKAPGSTYRAALPVAPAAGEAASAAATADVWASVMRSMMRSDAADADATTEAPPGDEGDGPSPTGAAAPAAGADGGPTAILDASTDDMRTCSSTAIVSIPARRSTMVAGASMRGGVLSGTTSMWMSSSGPSPFDDASDTDAPAEMLSRPASERAPTDCTAAAREAADISTTIASE